MYSSIHIPRPGAEMSALSLGKLQGEPVLALHGWLDNGASFIPVAEHLPEHHIVALDFPGHGTSAHRPPGAVYHFVDYISDVAYAVQELGWQQFHLIGHSLGANVALAFCAVFPNRVKSLVLLDGVGPTSGQSSDTVTRLRHSIESQINKKGFPSRTYPDWEALINARCEASPISRYGAELLVRRGAHEEAGRIQVHSDRRLRTPSPSYLSEPAVMNLVQQVTVPTLVILAEQGVVVSRNTTHQRIASLGNCTTIVLPGNHHLHMDTAELAVNAMLPFLASSPPS